MGNKQKQKFNGIPSQTEVPAQTRYPHEDSANQMIHTTALPLAERLGYSTHNEDGQSTSMQIPVRIHRYGEFMHHSATIGRKK